MKEHGLVPIPVDYDLETMAPRSFDEIKNAITEKVKILDLNNSCKDKMCVVCISFRSAL